MITDAVDHSSKKRRTMLLVGVYLLQGYLITTDLAAMLAIPKTLLRFDAESSYGILLTVYMLVMAIATPVGGKLGDLFGRKKIAIISTSIYILGTFFCATALRIGWYYAGFVLLGAGLGLAIPLPVAIIRDVTPYEEMPKYVGYYTSVNNASMLLGPLCSGIIIDLAGPSIAYIFVLPLAAIALWLLGNNYDSKPYFGRPYVDYPGILFLALGVGPLLLLFTLGGTAFPWLSTTGLLLLAVGVLFVIVFIGHERKVPEPIIPLDLFQIRSFRLACAMPLTIMAYSAIVSSFLVLFAQIGLGVSATVSGTLTIPKTLVTILLPAIVGAWVSKASKVRIKTSLTIAGVFVMLGCLVLGIGAGTPTALAMIYLSMALLGLGESFYYVAQSPYLQSELPLEKLGAGISTSAFLSTLCIATYMAVYGGVLNSFKGNIAGAMPVMAYIAAASATAFLLIVVFGVKREQ